MHTINQVVQSLNLVKDEIAAIHVEAITKEGEIVTWMGADKDWASDPANREGLIRVLNAVAKRVPENRAMDPEVQDALHSVEKAFGTWIGSEADDGGEAKLDIKHRKV